MYPLHSSTASSRPLIDRNRRDLIDGALTCLPGTLVELIAEYDTSLALQPLVIKAGQSFFSTGLNGLIIRAIEEVLTSAQADPVIKRKVLVNAILFGYVDELNYILDDIRRKNLIINLDHIDLSNLPMGTNDQDDADRQLLAEGVRFLTAVTSLKLTRVSAVHANFSHSALNYMNLRGANLTAAVFSHATFTRTCLIDANLYGAQFDHTRFVMCSATGLVTNDHGLIAKAWRSHDNLTVRLDGLHTTRLRDLVLEEITLKPDHNLFKGCCCTIV